MLPTREAVGDKQREEISNRAHRFDGQRPALTGQCVHIPAQVPAGRLSLADDIGFRRWT